MLTITVAGVESFDNEKQEFVYGEPTVLSLEHSLASLSKWESIFQKPFLGKGEKTPEETFAYIHCMCLDENVPGEVLFRLKEEQIREINDYIESKMTATWFREDPGAAPSREIITNEVIRHWMIALGIPYEYEFRHLNQLLTLIRVVNEKNKPKKKMSRAEAIQQQRELNAQRRAQLGTSG